MATTIIKNGKKYNSVTGKEITPKFPKHTAEEVKAMQTPEQRANRLRAGVGQPTLTAEELRAVDFPEEVYDERQKLLGERQKKADELPAPEQKDLIPEGKPGQREFAESVPIVGPAIAGIGTAMDPTDPNVGTTATELFGTFGEVLGLSRLPWIGSYIGGMINAPASSAKSLASQTRNIVTDVRRTIEKSSNPEDALVGLNELKAELDNLEGEITGNIARSSELRANPEEVDKISRDIYTARYINSLKKDCY